MSRQEPNTGTISPDIPNPFEGEKKSNTLEAHKTDFRQTNRPTDYQTNRPRDLQDTLLSLFSSYKKAIDEQIATRVHNNNDYMFKVCRVLRTVERDYKRTLTESELRQVFDYWASKSKAYLRPEMSHEDYFAEFWRIFDATKSCHDQTALSDAYNRMRTAGYPPGHERLKDENHKQLASFCYQLSLLSPDGTFFLTGKDVEKFFPRVGEKQNRTLLRYMCREQIGILKRISKGHTGRASVYIYIGGKKQKNEK